MHSEKTTTSKVSSVWNVRPSPNTILTSPMATSGARRNAPRSMAGLEKSTPT